MFYQAFQFIQEYTGIVSPGILSVFVLGLVAKPLGEAAKIFLLYEELNKTIGMVQLSLDYLNGI